MEIRLNTPSLCCPNCGFVLNYISDKYICNKCKREYPIDDGIIALTDKDEYYIGEIDKNEMLICLALMKNNGFTPGLSKYLNEIPVETAGRINSSVFNLKSNAFEPFLQVNKDSSLLSLGVGWGSLTVSLAEKYSHVTAMDMTRERLMALHYRLIENNIKNVDLILSSSIHRLPFSNSQFDAVTLLGMSEYADVLCKYNSEKKQAYLLSEVYRILKPNGTLILGINNKHAFKNPFSLSTKNKQCLELILSYYSSKRLLKKVGFLGNCILIPKPDCQNMHEIIPITKHPWNLSSYEKGSILLYYHKLVPRILSYIIKLLKIEHLFAKNYLIVASKSLHSNSIINKVIDEYSKNSGDRWYISKIRISNYGCSLFSLISKNKRAFGRMPLCPSAYKLLLSGNELKDKLLTNEELPQSIKWVIPRTLFSYSYQGNIACIEEYLDGSAPNPKEKDQPWFFEAIEFISVINRITMFKLSNKNGINDDIDYNKFKKAGIYDLIMPIAEHLINTIQNNKLPLALAHGDYWHGNLMVDKAGKLNGVIDWDMCCSQQIVGYDVMILLKDLRECRLKGNWFEFIFSYEELDSFLSIKEKEAVINYFDILQIMPSQYNWNVIQGLVWLSQLNNVLDELPILNMNILKQVIIPTANKLNKLYQIKST